MSEWEYDVEVVLCHKGFQLPRDGASPADSLALADAIAKKGPLVTEDEMGGSGPYRKAFNYQVMGGKS